VNDDTFDFSAPVISNASCTTNCAAPLFKILNDHFDIITGSATTCHAYTATQSLVDESNKEKERSRAAAINIVPSSSGASKAVVKVIPALKGKIEVMSLRVPVPTVSFTDLTIIVKNETSTDQVHAVFKAASEGAMKGILGYSTDILVSSDFIGSPYSCIYDANYTKVTNGHMIKVCGWYDNEWGYSNRVVDLVNKLS
jgi:glyceraldehyde 3-phosphate dehydrogenase